MPKDVFWKPWTVAGLEHLRLRLGPADALDADGVILRAMPAGTLRFGYHIRCDETGRTRSLRAWMLDGDAPLDLRGDGQGCWTSEDGRPVPALDGCLDVDIALTPFTNTLPIRRLGLRAGASADIGVVYLQPPVMTVQPARQRYTLLRAGGGARPSLWRYEGLDTGFTTELEVDPDGLVLDYPGIWRRVPPAAEG